MKLIEIGQLKRLGNSPLSVVVKLKTNILIQYNHGSAEGKI